MLSVGLSIGSRSAWLIVFKRSSMHRGGCVRGMGLDKKKGRPVRGGLGQSSDWGEEGYFFFCFG
jgi:hypothetical protein